MLRLPWKLMTTIKFYCIYQFNDEMHRQYSLFKVHSFEINIIKMISHVEFLDEYEKKNYGNN